MDLPVPISSFIYQEKNNSREGSYNPGLGQSVRADLEALQNDFEQATEFVRDLQGELSGKSNDLAHLKHLFEKTTGDMQNLQKDIAELRKERHTLANEAMKASALEHILQTVTEERDQLKIDIAILRARPEPTPTQSIPHSNGSAPSLKVARLLQEVTLAVANLQTALGSLASPTPTPLPPRPRYASTPSAPEPEFIKISFID